MYLWLELSLKKKTCDWNIQFLCMIYCIYGLLFILQLDHNSHICIMNSQQVQEYTFILLLFVWLDLLGQVQAISTCFHILTTHELYIALDRTTRGTNCWWMFKSASPCTVRIHSVTRRTLAASPELERSVGLHFPKRRLGLVFCVWNAFARDVIL